MNLFEWQAGIIEGAGRTMAYAIENTDQSKVEWKPVADASSKCRCILDMAAECIGLNKALTRMFSGAEMPARAGGPPERTFANSEEAQQQLTQSAKELGAVVRGLDESVLDHRYPTPFGPMKGSLLLMIAAGNMQYHSGQINQIQLLYGDTEDHFPPEAFE
ncbi:MAG TPA: hypothetical protein VGS41_18605 [Chthonomonadales bacterium]|nr:hypothetical protein [Chthonomonadales bacterium]